jgi:hypothetical protein
MSTTIVGIQLISEGFHGAPGYTTFYFEGASEEDRDAACEDALAFWTEAQHWFPSSWHAAFAAEHRVVDDVTGELLDLHPTPESCAGTLTGSDGANRYAAGPAGACLSWSTNTINWSRRVRGRTFLVPVGGSAIGTDGTLDTGGLNGMVTHGGILIAQTTSVFGIWSRPRNKLGGKFAPATAVHVKDQAAVLRSRR